MNPILMSYLIYTFICIALNHKFYKKILLKDGKERTYNLITYAVLTFLGPFSLFLTIYCKIKNYIKIRRSKKELKKMIFDELIKACKECGVTVVD